MNSATDNTKKILIVTEGSGREYDLMKAVFSHYPELAKEYELTSYNTTIYDLYDMLFQEDDKSDDLDWLLALKDRAPAEERYKFNIKYTDKLLIFDLDCHAPKFSKDKIRRLQAYFSESTENGRLYLSYPMIEAFYHLTSFPDPSYNDRSVRVDDIPEYKATVGKESHGRYYPRYSNTKQKMNLVIMHNVEKAAMILNIDIKDSRVDIDPGALLNKQLEFLDSGFIKVLCTSVMYVYEYNPKLLNDV